MWHHRNGEPVLHIVPEAELCQWPGVKMQQAWTNVFFMIEIQYRYCLVFYYVIFCLNIRILKHCLPQNCRNCSTVECRYKDNAVQYNKILHIAMQWWVQNKNQTLDLQKTHHTSPWRASYGVSFARILDKIDCIITAPLSIYPETTLPHCLHWCNLMKEMAFWIMPVNFYKMKVLQKHSTYIPINSK